MESVTAVLKRRDRLVAAIAAAAGPQPLREALGPAADAAVRVLKKCDYAAVFKSLTAAAGDTAESAAVRDLCWAMAADTESLRAKRPVTVGLIPATPTAVAVQFRAATRRPEYEDATDGFPVRYRAQVLVGPGAPAVFEFNWTSKFVAWFAARPDGLGFAGRKKVGFRYADYTTLVAMRCVLEVSSSGGVVTVHGARCPAAHRRHNTALTAMRMRATFTCPFGYEHHCHDCWRGQDTCPAAVRPLALEDKLCVRCRREAPHDPAWKHGVCQSCARAKPKR